MSQVKVQGNASGTGIFTIASPNSNSNYTFTLPTETGTVLTNTGPYTASSSATAGAVTIDASNNVGIGVTPASFATVKALQLNTTGTVFSFTDELDIAQNVYYNAGNKYITSAAASMYVQAGGQHIWYRAASGTAGNAINFSDNGRFDSSGNFLVGTGSQIASGKVVLSYNGIDNNGIVFNDTATSSTTNATIFRRNGVQVGSINTTTTATTYSTSSDYRLKHDITPMTGALAKVAALKPVTYKWNADGSDGQGFIAHELQAVVPDCVTGEKDAVDAEGKPIYQGIDTSFLVATLTAALQELNAKVEAQAAEIAALKGAK